jgi:hypothetical protein
MLVLDALFDHIQQISSNVKIIGAWPVRPISAIDVRVGVKLGSGSDCQSCLSCPQKAGVLTLRSNVRLHRKNRHFLEQSV